MKGGISAMLEAVSTIDFRKLKYGMKLYFTYDEEIGFQGTYDLINENEKFPDVMIFGEPTNNEILIGHKGLLEYELIFKGVKVHSSNPEKGKSANMNAVKFLTELDDFYQTEVKTFQEEKFEVPYTTMNVGMIRGGSAINSVSAECKVYIDFRIANQAHISQIEKKMEVLGKQYDCNVKVIESVEPFINLTDLVEETKTANFMTEASFIKNSIRLILGVGPVTAHEVNEYITEKSYQKLVKQYQNLIIRTLSQNE